jgi:hypothetical protein
VAKKSRKSQGRHDDFFNKVAIAVLAAAAGAGTSEGVKLMNDRPASPQTVVIIERDRGSQWSSAGGWSPDSSREKPSADPPAQSGAIIMKDHQGKLIDEKNFHVSHGLFSNFFLESVGTIAEPSNAVEFNVRKGEGNEYSLWVDKASLSNAYARHAADKGPRLDLSNVARITLDLAENKK